MTKMTVISIYGKKNFSVVFLLNQVVDNIKPWYTVSGTYVLNPGVVGLITSFSGLLDGILNRDPVFV